MTTPSTSDRPPAARPRVPSEARARGFNTLEWRIAWRHLRVGERHPKWVDALTLAAVFVLVIGVGMVVWAQHLGPIPEPGEQLFSAESATALQRQFGVFGGLSLAIGAMLLVLAALARFFNLLATIITMSVLLGCMALVVVLSLMSGLEADLRDKILNQKAHLRISARDSNKFSDYEVLTQAIAALPEVAGASPYLEAEIMVRSGINRQGAVLLGVQPDRLLDVSNIAEIMREGEFDNLNHPEWIPEPDPFAGPDPETPWRLRHLDKKPKPSSASSNSARAGAKLREKVERELPDLDTLPDAAPANKPVADPDLRKLAPPPELFGGKPPGPFGPPGLDMLDIGGQERDFVDEDGWEDPVEALGLGPESATPPAKIPVEIPKNSERFGGPPSPTDEWDEGEWEDPVEALGLAPEAEPEAEPEAVEPPTEGPNAGTDPAGAEVRLEQVENTHESVIDPILIGSELANELAVGVGARVQLITPVGRLTPAGRVPGILASRVGGVFHSGMYEYDRKNVYMPLPVAQAFLRTGDRISGIEIKLHDLESLDAGKAAVEAALLGLGRTAPALEGVLSDSLKLVPDEALRLEIAKRNGIESTESELIVESWKELNRNLFSAMFLEKIAMFVALLFVVLVASFGILASNLMSVLEKSKEIAILKAMGSPDQLIQRVFVAEGLVLGVLGAVGGITLGLGLCLTLDRFGFPFNENVYYIETLPVVVNPFEVVVVGAAALLIVFMATLYPAHVASRMRPIDGLRQQES